VAVPRFQTLKDWFGSAERSELEVLRGIHSTLRALEFVYMKANTRLAGLDVHTVVVDARCVAFLVVGRCVLVL
jgi:hypothetical protein